MEEENKPLLVEVASNEQSLMFSNPLDENPSNLHVGGKYIVGKNVVDANGNVIGEVKTAPVKSTKVDTKSTSTSTPTSTPTS